jgi:biopolymer transport protein ExbD/biopolymer transport protein TolR
MAFGRLERSSAPKPMSEINMTPLIDVMLVLLVIFMITAPLMSSSLPLDLPQTDAAQPSGAETPFTLSVNPAGQAFVDDKPLSDEALSTELSQLAKRQPDAEVQLRADKTVPYGRVAELLGLVQKAGLSRIGFAAEAPQATPEPPATQNAPTPAAATTAPR